jgi:hypothetical protein
MKVERIPPQTPEEINQIRNSFYEESYYRFKKEDRKQVRKIKGYIKGDEKYEEGYL